MPVVWPKVLIPSQNEVISRSLSGDGPKCSVERADRSKPSRLGEVLNSRPCLQIGIGSQYALNARAVDERVKSSTQTMVKCERNLIAALTYSPD